MTNAPSPQDDFESSAQRFAEAAAALEELRDNLEALEGLKEQQAQTSEALKESSSALHAAVEALSPVGELGTELLATLQATVATAEAVFDQATVRAVKDDIAALSQEVELLRDGIRAERDEALQQLAEIQAKVQALPKRVRSKHGLN